MHILIAPNSFKNSLDATAVSNAIREGLLQSRLNCTCECFPIADGGDGTATLLIEKLNGIVVHKNVHDPLGRIISASFGLIDNGKTAVIESANASGLKLLQPSEYNPLHTTTFGTGELILQALDKGVNKLIMGIGGSATVEGATGILQALGARFYNEHKKELPNLPEQLIHASFVDTSGIDKKIYSTEIVVLCDVKNFLLGANGAASVFGPQKGATSEDVIKLERLLTNWRDVTLKQTGQDMAVIEHGGAAGGVAAGLAAYLNAKLANGIDSFLQLTGFDAALQNVDILITGEGSIDEQTLQGKAPFGVAYKAKEKNIPVIALAGRVPLHSTVELKKYFDVLLPINNELSENFLINTKENLKRTATELGNLLVINERI